jgi:hypothetical protein
MADNDVPPDNRDDKTTELRVFVKAGKIDGRKLAGERRRKENRAAAEKQMIDVPVGGFLPPVESRRELSLGDRISQAIKRNYRLNQLAKELEINGTAGLDPMHARVLIELLTAQINARKSLKRALLIHLQWDRAPAIPGQSSKGENQCRKEPCCLPVSLPVPL